MKTVKSRLMTVKFKSKDHLEPILEEGQREISPAAGLERYLITTFRTLVQDSQEEYERFQRSFLTSADNRGKRDVLPLLLEYPVNSISLSP